MKKVLTVLLAKAVMFTNSFGSAFAATTYTEDDYRTALNQQKTDIMSYLESYKSQAVNAYNYNNLLFAEKTGKLGDDEIKGYQKEAFIAAADAVIEAAGEAIDAAIKDKLATDFPAGTVTQDEAVDANYLVSTTPGANIQVTLGSGSKGLSVILTKEGMKEALELMTEDLEKAQAPLTRKAVEAKMSIALSKYNSEDKDYFYVEPTSPAVIGTVSKTATSAAGEIKLTAADAVSALLEDLDDALTDADKITKAEATNAGKEINQAKREAYEEAYAAFKTQLEGIDNLDDEAFNEIDDSASLEGELNDYISAAYSYLPVLKTLFATADDVSWNADCATGGKWEEFWEGKTKTSTDGKLFGVDIANNGKVTRTEAMAVYNAMKKAIDDSRKVVEAYAKAKATNGQYAAVIVPLHDNETAVLSTLSKSMDAADVYADVVKYGEKLKGEYLWGVKQYDDAKVDAAVKEAEELVYGDVGTTTKYGSSNDYFKTPEEYIIDAANEIAENNDGLLNLKLEEAKYAYTKFKEAVEDAAEKMYKNGTAAYNVSGAEVTKKVTYGEDKTAEADLVYLLETYYTKSGSSDQTGDWNKIAQDTLEALLDAQSYDEIDSIMKKAAEDFGKLLKEDDFKDVDKARSAYNNAIEGFIKQTYDLLDDQAAYSEAFTNGNFTELQQECEDLINDANTVEEVKAAYAEAQALVTGVKSDDELKAMRKAVEKKFSALPSLNKLTVADKDAVKEAFDAYVEYKELVGSKDFSTIQSDLYDKYDKVNALLVEELDDAAEALLEKMDVVDTNADADLAKYLAFKEEAKALIAKGDAIQAEIDAADEDHSITLTALTFGKDYEAIEAALGLDLYEVNGSQTPGYGNFYNKEIRLAKTLLIKATKPGATGADMQAALDAYNALTQRQQYELDGDTGYYLELVKVINEKLGGNVKELKITAKSTAKKGSITVKWTVKGDADVDGFEIWKSTKHSKGYKKAFTTTKQTYKNSKGLKKGTRYYYKVRAYKMVDGVKITSDWSNKARRVAK